MASAADNALIVQSDSSVLLDVHDPRAGAARRPRAVRRAGEEPGARPYLPPHPALPLERAGCGDGRRADGRGAARARQIPVPPDVEQEVLELAARYGRVVIARDGDGLRCTCHDRGAAERLARRQGGRPVPDPAHRRDELPRRSRRARDPQAGAGCRGLSGRGPRRLRRRRALRHGAARDGRRRARRFGSATTSATPSRPSTPAGPRAAAAASSSCPAAPARPSSASPRWPW